ncbi:hypothetical protein PQR71_39830 [Paraburkholderia fungorum]|uniref:hypothetical protein n=1 Tax=Paraburkholderia fungorum TaxID=134537 RepID=UPI0038BB782D
MANISRVERERRAALTQEAQMADTEQKNSGQKADEVKYVKMIRDALMYPAPHEANVHPKEVSNFARGGWEIV